MAGPNLVGTTIAGRFELLAFTAAGGMGHVYRARDLESGAIVALKLLAPLTGDRERFEREASLLATLHHPGVVRHLAHGATPDGAPFLAMEWLVGEDLADRLGAEGTLHVDDAVRVAVQVAEALAATHRAGIIHRDLKPANLFLVEHRFEKVKLLDFGVARTVAKTDLTMTGVVVGTPAYMAPEQVRGDAIEPSADVYGAGAVLYRCLTGQAPFRGTHELAILAKVIIEPPRPVSELRAEVPAALDALVMRLLSKRAADRPRDGAALLAELEAQEPSGKPSERRVRSSISAREKRIACVVLCAGGTAEDVTLSEERAASTDRAAREAVEAHGGSIAAIARGAWLVTIPTAASAGDQALRAARCALALATIRPDTPLFVATGRVLVTGEGRVGEVIDRAAAALVAARDFGDERGVRIDSATAELLEGRFRVGASERPDDEWRVLLGEDESPPERTLLGKPTRCIGREAQLAMLSAAITACTDERRAGAALVIAPIGLGKTHLVRELLRTTREANPELEVLSANGDPIRMTSAFGMAAQLLAREAGLRDADAPAARAEKLAALVARDIADDEERPRMRELLGEICGVVTPPEQASAALRAARSDLTVMADALRGAWTAWLGALTDRATILVLLEDVHWADQASVQLMDAAVAELAEQRLFVLATGRPEGSQSFADRFRSRGLVELRLPRLSAGSAERLVRGALGEDLSSEITEALVKRAGGHPFHLEELVRAVASGRGPDALPDTVLAMVQARLDELGTDARRMLRAASVFGEAFRAAGVAALMGDETSEHEVRSVLAQLVTKELVMQERASKRQDAPTHSFRHMMLRDAAYAMLTDVDCVQAHRRAAMWLESVGESDPAVLGEHYDRGRVPERAVIFFQRAAAQALKLNDFERAHHHVQRALALHPDADAEAALRAIEAEILFWRGDLATAAERTPSALQRLRRGAPEWFGAVSVAMGALGQLGRNDEVATLLRDAASVPSGPESREAHVVALCRGMTQLFWAHAGAGLDDVRSCLDELVVGAPLDAYQTGWVHRVRGEAAWLHERNVSRCLAELEASCVAFERAQALRPLCLSRLNAASLSGWSGDIARGLELVALARVDAERLRSGFLVSYGRAVEGLLLAYGADPGAEPVMRRALGEVSGSPRLAFISHLVLASTALDRKDVAAAEAEVTAARALGVVDDLRSAGLALASRIAREKGRLDEALDLAQEATRLASGCVDLELTHGMDRLALAEVHVARGDREAARAALGPATHSIDTIAETIASPAQRDRFRARPIANGRISQLAFELVVAT